MIDINDNDKIWLVKRILDKNLASLPISAKLIFVFLSNKAYPGEYYQVMGCGLP